MRTATVASTTTTTCAYCAAAAASRAHAAAYNAGHGNRAALRCSVQRTTTAALAAAHSGVPACPACITRAKLAAARANVRRVLGRAAAYAAYPAA